MDAELVKAVSQSIGTVLAAIIVGICGGLITYRYNVSRAKQDRESEWRKHALELTKLDLERRINGRSTWDEDRLRPSILDFLANYRDLKELDKVTPKELYITIEENRITAEEDRLILPVLVQCAMELAKMDTDILKINPGSSSNAKTGIGIFVENYRKLTKLHKDINKISEHSPDDMRSILVEELLSKHMDNGKIYDIQIDAERKDVGTSGKL